MYVHVNLSIYIYLFSLSLYIYIYMYILPRRRVVPEGLGLVELPQGPRGETPPSNYV